MNNPAQIREEVGKRRVFLINKLLKWKFDSVENLTKMTLPELEAAYIRHMSEIGKSMSENTDA